MTNRIQLRRDTSANWTRVNPILEDGEPGLDTTTNKIKYGDGSTAWEDLDYAGGINVPYTFPATDGTPYQTLVTDGNGHLSWTDEWDNYISNGTSGVTIPGENGDVIISVEGSTRATFGATEVSIQSNDSSNNFTWNFTTYGGISLPALLSNQGHGNVDSTNNVLSLMSNDTVDFHDFSGMILVNCHNSGNITLYLCGGGTGSTTILGSSKVTDVGALAFNAGIGGYTFTADETGDHVFFTIRTRTGA